MGTYGDAVAVAALGSSDPPCHPGNLSVVRTSTHIKVFSADPTTGVWQVLMELLWGWWSLSYRSASCAAVATDSIVNKVTADCSAHLVLLDYQWIPQSSPQKTRPWLDLLPDPLKCRSSPVAGDIHRSDTLTAVLTPRSEKEEGQKGSWFPGHLQCRARGKAHRASCRSQSSQRELL